MSATLQSGVVRRRFWDTTIELRWKLKEWPEREPYYSVKQDFGLPQEQHLTTEQFTTWLHRRFAEAGFLKASGFTIEVPVDHKLYWSRDELPNGWKW